MTPITALPLTPPLVGQMVAVGGPAELDVRIWGWVAQQFLSGDFRTAQLFQRAKEAGQ